MSRLDIDKTFKIILVGDSKVGKTSIIRRYTDNTFTTQTLSTIGSDFNYKLIQIENYLINLNIWDTAGQERFKSLTFQYYKRASGVFIVFDVSNRKSFKGLLHWLEDVNNNCPDPNIIKLLIGNKIDLNREVEYDEANSFAIKNNMDYIETSASEDVNINKAFEELARIMWSNRESILFVQDSGKEKLEATRKILPPDRIPDKGGCSCG